MTVHGRDCPDRCSMCKGAVPRRVEQQGSSLVIDGQPPRAFDPGAEAYVQVPRHQRRNRGKK